MKNAKQQPAKQEQKHLQQHSQVHQQQKTRQGNGPKKQGLGANVIHDQERPETRMTD